MTTTTATIADNSSQSAYEMLYALMETAYSRINKIELFDRVIAGLKDDNDIRTLCNLIVTKLLNIDPEETLRRLDPIAEAYRAVLSTKLKEGSVKQEVEKQDEANRSALRVTLLLADRTTGTGAGGTATQNTNSNQVWDAYWDWVSKDFQPQLRQLREEGDGHRAKTA